MAASTPPRLIVTDVLIDAARGLPRAVLIPATAMDVRHFQMIPDLQVIRPY